MKSITSSAFIAFLALCHNPSLAQEVNTAKPADTSQSQPAPAPVASDQQLPEHKGNHETDGPASLSVSPPAPSRVVQDLGPDQLEQFGISFRFSGRDIQTIGNLNSECAKGLEIKEVRKELPEKLDESDLKSNTKAHASTVGIRVVFNGTTEMPSLDSCEKKFASVGERVELDTQPHLSRLALAKDELALFGFINKGSIELVEPAVKSRSLELLETRLEKTDCKECSLKELNKRVSELASMNIPGLAPVIASLIESSINETVSQIAKAKKIADLEQISRQLEAYTQIIRKSNLSLSQKESMIELLAPAWDSIIAQNQKLAYSPKPECQNQGQVQATFSLFGSKKSACDSETDHADFMAQTFSRISSIPGISSEIRDEAARLSDEFTAGNARTDFIQTLNPLHPEVISVLQNGSRDLMALNYEASIACGRGMRFDMAQCEMAKQKLQVKMQQLNTYAGAALQAQALQAQAYQSQGQQFAGAQGPGVPLNNQSVNAGNFMNFNPNVGLNSGLNFNSNALYTNQLPSQGQPNGLQFQNTGFNSNQLYQNSQAGTHYAIPLSSTGSFNNGFNNGFNGG